MILPMCSTAYRLLVSMRIRLLLVLALLLSSASAGIGSIGRGLLSSALKTKTVERPQSGVVFIPEQEHASTQTYLGELVRYFRPVLRGEEQLIDIPCLLKACEKFESRMREVGQKQSANDLDRNIRKVKDLVAEAPEEVRNSMLSLLEYEKGLGIHEPGGVIRDPSGAVGLLWIRRSINFQYRMYKLVLEYNKSPKDAAMISYGVELQPYHSWALQRIYTIAMKAKTPALREDMLANVGGFPQGGLGKLEEQAIVNDLRELMDVWQPLLARWKEIYSQLDLEDTRRV